MAREFRAGDRVRILSIGKFGIIEPFTGNTLRYQLFRVRIEGAYYVPGERSYDLFYDSEMEVETGMDVVFRWLETNE